MVVPRALCLQLAQYLKKNLNTHMQMHTHIKELLALNTVHVPVFLHTRTQQPRVAPDEINIVAVCVHVQIK